MRACAVSVAATVLLILGAGAGYAAPLPPDIRANGINIEARVTAAFVLPGQPVTISYLPRNLDETLTLTSADGAVIAMREGQWLFQPKRDGISELHLTTAEHQLTLRVFTLTPFSATQQTELRGYPIGRYPHSSRRGYRQPSGLLAVTEEMFSEPLSEHFTLGQFVTASRTGTNQPHFALVTTALLETLEHLLTTLRNKGWSGATLTILSGYRTPLHNARVGGAATSRHIYGDAVDLIADADGDGAMDDLNEDGVGDRDDVEWLIAQFMRQAIPATMGGAGSYETQGPAGAFLHLDTRGTPAAWQR
ncbi:MAG: D-Ala-D-Ala carboxypeptidase family metallohydrolase [Pseudomonadales bacterium]